MHPAIYPLRLPRAGKFAGICYSGAKNLLVAKICVSVGYAGKSSHHLKIVDILRFFEEVIFEPTASNSLWKWRLLRKAGNE